MIKFILMYIWQLPQNIAGLLLYFIYHRDDSFWYKGKLVGIDDRFVSNKKGDTTHNGISLGMYIILEKYSDISLLHEYGHSRDSERWGLLYLPVIGLCSGVHNIVHRIKRYYNIARKNYYKFWTERRADRLGGLHRNEDGSAYHIWRMK